MSIDTIQLTQQKSYQQTSSQNRKVTLVAPKDVIERQESKTESTTSLSNKLVNINSLQKTPAKGEVEQLIYEKPKEVKLQLMVLVLERFLGRALDISDFSLTANKNQQSNSTANGSSVLNKDIFTPPGGELINIDGQSFQQGDVVSVEQWNSREQQLDYQVQGTFKVNERELFLDYKYSLASEQVSYSKIEMSVEALKDPIIVQFGAQGLGEISGQKDFDINQDSSLNILPVFSGDVGYLVYDKNHNNKADDGGELFGPETGQGFTELALLDSNKNGFIDAEDQHFEKLYLWQPGKDNNQAEQWLSLKEAEIQAISVSATSTPYDFYDQQGEIQAQLRQSSFAISDNGTGRGVHQVDVRI
jgi:hypothetical protein